MNVHFTCENPECSKSLHAPLAAAGKKARCPHCGTVQVVPASQAPANADQMDLTTTSLLGQMDIKPITLPPQPQPIVPSKRPYAIAAIVVVGVLVLVIAVLALAFNKSDKRDDKKNPPVAQASTNDDKNTPPAVSITPVVTANPPAVVAAAPKQADLPATSSAQTSPTNPPPQPVSSGQQNNDPVIAPTPIPIVLSPGNLPAAYLEVVLGAKAIAQMQVSKTDMDAIEKAVQIYNAQNDGKLPNSFDDMIKAGVLGDNKILMSVGKSTVKKVFISGQQADSPGKNILVYDPIAYQGTKIVVLLVDGTATYYSPEEMYKQLLAQKAKPEEMPSNKK